jgi:hypothetical protein
VVRPGDRVRMTGIMRDDPAPMEVGAEGTVREIWGNQERWDGSQLIQIDVEWDNGRSLMLLPNDPFTVIRRAEDG